jgi:hypothetical protein
MKATKGYYSLIQFCPDPSRAEAVNVGVVLFCPEAKFIAARTVVGNQRPAKLVGRAKLDRNSLTAAKRAMERRLEVDREAFQSLQDLEQFVASRGNILKLTHPRPVKVFDPSSDLNRLFSELVGGTARPRREMPIIPELDSLFRILQNEGRAKLDWRVQVPILQRPIRVPYAYRNGTWNLIVPHRFSKQERPAVSAAMRLAIEGDLLQKHGRDKEGEKKLIVIAKFEGDDYVPELEQRIHHVLHEYKIDGKDIDEFPANVHREAHS